MSDFKGVWIPAEVWQIEDLLLIEKVFLCQIQSLCNDDGCFASNSYFAKFFGVSNSRCTQIIKKLEEQKYISVELERKGKMVSKRVVTTLNKCSELFKHGSKYIKEGSKSVKHGSKQIKEGCLIDSEYNNTEDNNKELKKEKDTLFFEVFDHFVKVTGKQLRINKTNLKASDKYKKITSRLDAGFTVEDCKKVIDYKNNEWKADSKMSKYIEINTFFRIANFENYLDAANNTQSEPQTKEPHPQDLETYLLQYFRPIDLEHLKKGGNFQRYEEQLQENLFKLTNVAKFYKNQSITPLFLFELLYTPLGNRLNGSTPERKLDSFERFFKKLTDYNQNQGDMRQLVKDLAQTQ